MSSLPGFLPDFASVDASAFLFELAAFFAVEHDITINTDSNRQILKEMFFKINRFNI